MMLLLLMLKKVITEFIFGKWVHFWYKDDAINIIKNSDLNEKSGLS